MIKLNSDYGNGCNPSFVFEKKLHLKTNELKFRPTLFKGLRVWAEPIKSFLYIKLSGVNSKAVCVLRQCLKTGDSLLGKK